MTRPARIALTGATGFVGQAVLDEAERRGLALRALARRPQEPREGVEWIQGDLGDVAALQELVAGADGVLHIAGVVNAPGWDGFEAGNVTGTGHVVEAMKAAGVERLIHVSSLSAREPGLSNYGRSKRLGEQLVEASGLDWTIVRPPAIYGPRDREILEVFKTAKSGFVPMPPRGRASVIHVEDLARLLLDLVAADIAIGRIYEVDDGRPGGWSHEELARSIGKALGKRVIVAHMPSTLLHIGARIDELVRGKRAKLTVDRAGYMAHRDWTVRSAHKVPADVWSPRIELQDGMRATAAWYRERGWI